ncbi:MAG: O-linked N-acetylglucosamine transferase, SPINDLY family protein [Alphaproteobacteria bacterium]|nr:O-linked N-acetylglucosamine transferase, SPINDLY family protein [Alphaproteobacteria bacterium]
MSALGWAKLETGDLQGAQTAFKDVLNTNPQDVSALHGLGRVALAAKHYGIAADLLAQAGKLSPSSERLAFDHVQALGALSAVEPGNAQIHYALAQALMALGDCEAARDAALATLMADPCHVGARWLVNRMLPRIYLNSQEIAVWRRRLATGVAILEASVNPKSSEEAAHELPGLLFGTNFELAYQGQDDKPIQISYGRLVHRVMSAYLPDLASPPSPKPFAERQDKRIRLGFASSFFTSHTIALLFAGWMRHLDRKRFLVHLYLTNGKSDASTRSLAGMSDVFRELQGDLAQAARAIRADDLDALIYPDIGMDPKSMALASLKLAPLQMMSWGHPVTSGLASIDIFLSSELMEPEDAQSHYSERLVRLPNISVAYQPASLPQKKSRSDFGLPGEGSVLYLCCQAHQKYLPGFDRVFTDIARKLPNARFIFIKHRTRHLDNRRFQARLEMVFKSAGLDPAKHLHFLTWLDWGDYLDLNGVCDVFLDSIGWSGGNTTLEALSRHLPVVTLPSNLMRGRHAYAILKRLDLDDCIAKDTEGFVEIAVRLGSDSSSRQEIRDRIAAGRDRLFNDLAPVRALEEIVAKAVGA